MFLYEYNNWYTYYNIMIYIVVISLCKRFFSDLFVIYIGAIRTNRYFDKDHLVWFQSREILMNVNENLLSCTRLYYFQFITGH